MLKSILTISTSMLIFVIIWIGLGKLVEEYVRTTPWIMFDGVIIYLIANYISGISLEHLLSSIKVAKKIEN